MDTNETPAPAETNDKPNEAKHTVQRGVAYATLESGKITRNYVVLGGTRVYVMAEEGKELTKSQARRLNA